mmetsp:Transcript_26200/g.46758  ORF Transcript_26200/g.46758 Transcript_26200/m.46758 type:complete len:777 (+) Transcript_26200:127-2457(+)
MEKLRADIDRLLVDLRAPGSKEVYKLHKGNGDLRSLKNIYGQYTKYQTSPAFNFDTKDERVESIFEKFHKPFREGSPGVKVIDVREIFKFENDCKDIGVVIANESCYFQDKSSESLTQTVRSILTSSISGAIVVFPDVETCVDCLPDLIKLEGNEVQKLCVNIKKMKKCVEGFREYSEGESFNASIAYLWRFDVRVQCEDLGDPLLTTGGDKLLIVMTMNSYEPLLKCLCWVFYVACNYIEPKNVLFFSHGLKFGQESAKSLIEACNHRYVCGSYGIVSPESNLANPFIHFSSFESDLDIKYLKMLDASVGISSPTTYQFSCYKWSVLCKNSKALNYLFRPLVFPHKVSWSDNFAYLKCPLSVLNEALVTQSYESTSGKFKYIGVKHNINRYEFRLVHEAHAKALSPTSFTTDILRRASVLHINWMWVIRTLARRRCFEFTEDDECFPLQGWMRSLVIVLNALITLSLCMLIGCIFTFNIVGFKSIISFAGLSENTTELVAIGYKTLHILLMISTSIWSLSTPIGLAEARRPWLILVWMNIANTVLVFGGWVLNFIEHSIIEARMLLVICILVVNSALLLHTLVYSKKDSKKSKDVLNKAVKYLGYMFLFPIYINTIWIHAATSFNQEYLNGSPYYFGKSYRTSDAKHQSKLFNIYGLKRGLLLMQLIGVNVLFAAVFETEDNRTKPIIAIYVLFIVMVASPLIAMLVMWLKKKLCQDNRLSVQKENEVPSSSQEHQTPNEVQSSSQEYQAPNEVPSSSQEDQTPKSARGLLDLSS